ncbi:cytochrome P450 [Flexivirga sp. ID2601S]|uniref:Cytochrome P450 n=1 Tax=Flexivirga aerilata TaxID=1656889 RepID=A0A849AF24_9MICO|nr:cytochrome P450 [Flexivirga aerilata]NNG38497.1 cytochrome P450 [Flexivirga aerilata]
MTTTAEPDTTVEPAIRRLFTDPSVAANPYPTYRFLRENAPVHRSAFGHWVLSRYEDVEAVLRSPAVGKNVEAFIAGQGVRDWRSHESFTRMLDHLIWMNPPRHTRLRRLLASGFTPRAIQAFQPRIEERVGVLLEPLRDQREIDLLDVFAFPLPVAVIGTLLGVPQQDWPQFRRLVRDVTLCVEPSPSAEQLATADGAAHELNAYFDELIARRRRHPQDDLITHLVNVEIDGDRIAAGELTSLIQFLFGAGFETTTNLFGNGMLALLRHPGQLTLLRNHPDLIPGAVEELLRYDPSVQLTMRTALEDLPVGDHAIPRGDSIVLLLGAANHDPARYDNPDQLNVTRTEIHPLSFGGGIHFCLGAALGRLEGQCGFRALLSAFSDIELAGEPSWKSNLTLHGLLNLPLRVTSA